MTKHEKINQEFQQILNKCTFIVQYSGSFSTGESVKIQCDTAVPYIHEESKFNEGSSLFSRPGTNLNYLHPLSNFTIIDINGIDITNMSLKEYKSMLRKKKLINLLNDDNNKSSNT